MAKSKKTHNARSKTWNSHKLLVKTLNVPLWERSGGLLENQQYIQSKLFYS